MNKPASAGNMLLLPLDQLIDENMTKRDSQHVKLFARQFFATSSNSELKRQSEQALFSTVDDAWRFIKVRTGTAPKIEFIQAQQEKGGRQRPVTRLQILLDDMPFVVDSVRQALVRQGVAIRSLNNAVLQVKRSKRAQGKGGRLEALAEEEIRGHRGEALLCVTCSHIADDACGAVEKELRQTLKLIAAAVRDYEPMCRKVGEIRGLLQSQAGILPVSDEELKESCEFIDWIIGNHFTFLGYEEYQIRNVGSGKVMELVDDSRLGVSRFKGDIKPRTKMSELPKGTAELILEPRICSFAKSSLRSKIHRPAYYDYILIKEFDEQGNVVTEHRFKGLYTSSVYYRPALDIPLVRKKVETVLQRSGFAPRGHSVKELLQVINVFPRDELFQINVDQLLNTALEITHIKETRTSKLFVRRDSYGKFFSCLVYVPRDIFSTRVRLKIKDFLSQRLQATELDYNIYLSESILVRLHLVLKVADVDKVDFDLQALESELVALVTPWDDYFLESLQESHGDNEADHLHERWVQCYPDAYKDSYSTAEAVRDIARIERVLECQDMALHLAPCRSNTDAELRFKIFSYDKQLYLSDVDPILENLGLNIISEKTFRLQPEADQTVWLHDFSLFRKQQDRRLSESVADKFEAAFEAVWDGLTDDDTFNSLVITAGMNWRDVSLLRAYAGYLKQIQFGYSPQFIAETLAMHRDISASLLAYFYTLFDPSEDQSRVKRAQKLRNGIVKAIDAVVNLAEDSVLNAYLELIDATLRCNYFQTDAEGLNKDYISFKFDPGAISGMPLPKPKFEIFVFSRRMEGVHLRGGKVARGGLRWSDRGEDYRTEVLGLVKAQQVKNSVIVPVGAKGGFVVKQPMPTEDRDAQQQIAIACYQTLIRGMLDLTDNVVDGNVAHPDKVVRRDEDDTYLVVAADKGTATFSDIANQIAADYGFWLGDGFASGGSNGYDHKAMGITARGAWVSVQRHFRELGINVQADEITVLGIGDMSGDVFGNGMLLSDKIRLVAAFNHRHIFIDPDPDAAVSFDERQRLFNTPRSSWSDYNSKLISTGGGVFERSAKSIAISAAMKRRFDLEQDRMTPTQLINALLKSPVDLIWNGGIGTYVKSSEESHGEVGDKTNDPLRVDGDELRCRAIGEGGNLGLTQAARIEFGLNGGISLTDFIDNSAGVDCSDHEVNIKILLNRLQNAGDLTPARRNRLLESMTDAVADLVLDNNYNQVQTIGVAFAENAERHKEYSDLIVFLEENAGLNRELEFLPDRDELEERAAREEYLTRPELAVLTSYMKMYLKAKLVDESFIDDDYLEPYLFSAFPQQLVDEQEAAIREHPLRREIVATQLANTVVNLLGPSFVYRLAESTASSVSDVIKATVIAKDIYAIEDYWADTEALDYSIDSAVQTDMMTRLIRLTRRATRWLLRNRRAHLELLSEVEFFSAGVEAFREMLPQRLPSEYCEMFQDKRRQLEEQQVPEQLAVDICRCEFLFPAFSFVEISSNTGVRLEQIVDIYYAIGEQLQLNWLGKIINQLPVSNYWQVLARESYLDDLAWQQRALTCNVVSLGGGSNARKRVEQWAQDNEETLERMASMLNQLQTESQPDYAMFAVVLRELLTLAQTTAYRAE